MTQTKNGNGCLLIVIAIVVIGWLWGKINYAYTHYNEPDRASDNQVHEKNIKQNQLDGFKVPESCSYLGSLSGYEPNDYKGSYAGDTEYMCGTPYKNIGSATNSKLANNISYYVKGNQFSANELKLILNINQPKQSKSAKKELANAVDVLFEAVFDKKTDEKIKKSILAGTDGEWIVGSHKISLIKNVWSTGAGYELDFSIFYNK